MLARRGAPLPMPTLSAYRGRQEVTGLSWYGKGRVFPFPVG